MSAPKLDYKDRLILLNQYRILEKVDPKQAKSYREAIHILESGYEIHYDDLDESLSAEGVSETISKEVIEILNMYRRLHDSVVELGNKAQFDKKAVAFPGFDGNEEGKHLGYAHFLSSQGKFDETEIINSHFPSLGMYRRMLHAYEPFKMKRPLSNADIKAILDAQTHPENHR
jgi:uncharacterized protein YfbU (UPF0304 family)